MIKNYASFEQFKRFCSIDSKYQNKSIFIIHRYRLINKPTPIFLYSFWSPQLISSENSCEYIGCLSSNKTRNKTHQHLIISFTNNFIIKKIYSRTISREIHPIQRNTPVYRWHLYASRRWENSRDAQFRDNDGCRTIRLCLRRRVTAERSTTVDLHPWLCACNDKSAAR